MSSIQDLEVSVSHLVEQQFPAFYKEDGPNFIAFVKAYYAWMEQPENTLGQARSLPKHLDIDTSIEDFAKYFKSAYLKDIPSTSLADRAFSIKHIQDLYKTKGSEESLKLLFRLIYDTDVDVFKPGDNILRSSDGKWTIPKYLEVEYNPKCAQFVGNRITGATSKATAIVESVARRNINDRLIDVLYLSNIRGQFAYQEYITDSSGSLQDAPKVIGSLTSVTVVDGGTGISNGDVFSISGDSGKYGSVRIASTVNGNGQVDFRLTDGGSGYNANDTIVSVSNSVIFHSGNVFNTNTSIINYSIGEQVTQTAYRYTLANSEVLSFIPNNADVTCYDFDDNFMGTGTVFSTGNGYLFVSQSSNTSIATAVSIVLDSNTAVNTEVDFFSTLSLAANGIVMAVNSIAIGLSSVSSNTPFLQGASIKGANSLSSSINTRISKGTGASFEIGTTANTEQYNNTSIGTILSLASIRPGNDYDTPPFVTVINPTVSANARYDYSITLANTVGTFAVNQDVLANTVPGIIREIPGANALKVRRLRHGDVLANGSILVSYFANGTVSGTGTVVSVAADTSHPPMGNNAVISRNATSLSGVVSLVEVLDSGYGYTPGEALVLSSPTTNTVFTGTANIKTNGKSAGYWQNNRGKLNTQDVRIHDNRYYQEYSYEVRAELSIDKYSDVLRSIFHMAGTKMFGRVVKNTGTTVFLDSQGVIIDITIYTPPTPGDEMMDFSNPDNSQYLIVL